MERPLFTLLSLATASLVALPSAPLLASGSAFSAQGSPATLLARGGGGGGRGGGRGGGGGARGGGGHARTGFDGGGTFTRGDNRPSGGFSRGDRLNRVGNPSLSRPATRPAGGLDRPVARPVGGLERPDRTLSLDRSNRSISVDRDWNRQVNIGDINVHPGWARPGWGVARPWNWGWYGGWNTPPWGWWGAKAAAWGIGTLATAAIINSAVNDAVSNNETSIVVPNTSYELQFGTVQPAGEASVSFVVTANGTSYQLTGDCNAGTLNGREPNSSREAELLNAACQVAFGEAN